MPSADQRYAVVELITKANGAYVTTQLYPPPAGPGALIHKVPYKIKDTLFQPVIELDVGYTTDDDQSETVLFAESVQAVFRDNGVPYYDTDANVSYTLFTYYVLEYLIIGDDADKAFLWTYDPRFNLSIDPPSDSTDGTYGFPIYIENESGRYVEIPV